VLCWEADERKDIVHRTLTEEFLLLALDDVSGKPLLDSTKLHAAIAAAALVELTVRGALEVATADTDVKKGRLRRTGRATPTESIMIEILERAHGQKPTNAVSEIGGISSFRNRASTLKDQLLAGLAADGVLTEQSSKILGLFPTTSWKQHDGRVEHEIRTRVHTALTTTLPPDPQTAALVSLLSATDLAHRLFDGDKRQIRGRAKEISRSDWAGPAIKASVDEMTAVMTTVIVAGAVSSS
jgi:hypothetical protein